MRLLAVGANEGETDAAFIEFAIDVMARGGALVLTVGASGID